MPRLAALCGVLKELDQRAHPVAGGWHGQRLLQYEATAAEGAGYKPRASHVLAGC